MEIYNVDKLGFTDKEKENKISDFFYRLKDQLSDTYHLIISSKKHSSSKYLMPNGVKKTSSYSFRTKGMIRVSDHWNWAVGTGGYVSCRIADGPKPKKAPTSNKMVGILNSDGRFVCLYGEKFDKKQHMWIWVESTVEESVDKFSSIVGKLDYQEV